MFSSASNRAKLLSENFSGKDLYKHHSLEKDTTPTVTTTIIPTATTTTPPTKIPTLMSIHTSVLPRFCMLSSHTSSITIPLSPPFPLHPSFPGCCRNSNSWSSGGHPHYSNNGQKKLPSLGDFDASQQWIHCW